MVSSVKLQECQSEKKKKMARRKFHLFNQNDYSLLLEILFSGDQDMLSPASYSSSSATHSHLLPSF